MNAERILRYHRIMSATQIFQSSELNRGSAKVFSAASDSPVLVTRRDGENFVLMSEAEAEAQTQLLEFAAQLIAVTTNENGSLAERMTDRFPWMFALSERERETCADDLVRAARASFATGEAQLAIAELTAWKETATALAEGLTHYSGEWFEQPIPVSRPVRG